MAASRWCNGHASIRKNIVFSCLPKMRLLSTLQPLFYTHTFLGSSANSLSQEKSDMLLLTSKQTHSVQMKPVLRALITATKHQIHKLCKWNQLANYAEAIYTALSLATFETNSDSLMFPLARHFS